MIDCTEVNNSNKKLISKNKYKKKSHLKQSAVDLPSHHSIQSSYKYCLPRLSDVQQITPKDSDAVHSLNMHSRTDNNKKQSQESSNGCYKPKHKKHFSKKIEVAPRHQNKIKIKKNMKCPMHHQSDYEYRDYNFVNPCQASENDYISTEDLEPNQDPCVQKLQKLYTKEVWDRYGKPLYNPDEIYESSGRCSHNLKLFDPMKRNQPITPRKLYDPYDSKPKPEETDEIEMSESFSQKWISEMIRLDCEQRSFDEKCSDLQKGPEQESCNFPNESCEDHIQRITDELEKLLSDEGDLNEFAQ